MASIVDESELHWIAISLFFNWLQRIHAATEMVCYAINERCIEIAKRHSGCCRSSSSPFWLNLRPLKCLVALVEGCCMSSISPQFSCFRFLYRIFELIKRESLRRLLLVSSSLFPSIVFLVSVFLLSRSFLFIFSLLSLRTSVSINSPLFLSYDFSASV